VSDPTEVMMEEGVGMRAVSLGPTLSLPRRCAPMTTRWRPGSPRAGRAGLSGDGFADGGDYLGGPASQGLAGGGVVGAAVDEAGRVVVQDGGG
jgi:hypothetical protein